MEEDVDLVEARAEALNQALEDLKYELVCVRKQNGLGQDVVAERLGISQSAVSQFEHYDSNPTLSTLRRYALAVGARLEIRVVNDLLTPRPRAMSREGTTVDLIWPGLRATTHEGTTVDFVFRTRPAANRGELRWHDAKVTCA